MVGRGGQHPRRGARDLRSPRCGPRLEGAAAERGQPSAAGRLPEPASACRRAAGARSRPAGKVLTGLIAAALLALALVKDPPAVENALENEANERAAIAANRERIRRELTESQRPRRALLPASMPVAQALAAEVAADARRRVAAGTLDGPLGPTSCRPVRRSGGSYGATVFTCLVEQGSPRRVRRARDRDRLPLPRPRGDRERPRRVVQGEPAAAASRPGGVRGSESSSSACTG